MNVLIVKLSSLDLIIAVVGMFMNIILIPVH